MCFYQPNPPCCTCIFHQLIQPCDNATHYPPPQPEKNPKPLVKVCGLKVSLQGVGFRICFPCQYKQAQAMGQAQSHGLPVIDQGRNTQSHGLPVTDQGMRGRGRVIGEVQTGPGTPTGSGSGSGSGLGWMNGQEQGQGKGRESTALENIAMQGLLLAEMDMSELGTATEGGAEMQAGSAVQREAESGDGTR